MEVFSQTRVPSDKKSHATLNANLAQPVYFMAFSDLDPWITYKGRHTKVLEKDAQCWKTLTYWPQVQSVIS